MSKIRVYELARELGLENKALLDICEQLGLQGKRSHSSSLDDDEADRIRRSVIRKAVTSKEESVREVSTDGGVVTEHRVGNVIRRRKKVVDDEVTADFEERPRIDLKEAPRGAELPPSAPDYEQEKANRVAALALAESIFKQAADEESEAVSALSKAGDEPSSIGDSQAADQIVVGVPVTSADGPSDSRVEALSVVASESSSGQVGSELRRRGDLRGPKVLGKIELPVKVVQRREESGAVVGGSGSSVEARRPAAAAPAARPGRPAKRRVGEESELEVEELVDGAPRKKIKKKQVLAKGQLLDYEGERDVWRARKDKRKKTKDGSQPLMEAEAPRVVKKAIKIDGEVTVGELARNMGVKVGEVIQQLMALGVMATINQLIDFDTATLISSEFGFSVENTSQDDEEILAKFVGQESPEDMVLRPPVVTVMGHVDHGKTSLLDAIRQTSVTSREAGGITQHIGAYNVKLPSGGSVTFLDTPGHEAFTAMRSRGAKVTDIVVLVVAADDGVMPQTVEAINHAKAAGVPIIVAINKIDKPGANLDRIKTQISENGLVPEEWGGETILVPVSAKTREGLDTLLENLYAQAEILELKANPKRGAVGVVIESKLDRGRGPVMTVLVQAGTLRKGEAFLCGGQYGRVRALVADSGEVLEEAGPSIPVEVVGLSGVPMAGDDFVVLESESEARRIAEQRQARTRLKKLATRGVGGTALTLENFADFVKSGTVSELPLIVKADVQGSVEAVSEALAQLVVEDIKTNVIHKGVGAVSENDVQLAVASKALIVAFNVRADSRASVVAEQEGVEIFYSRIIYELVDQVKAVLKGRLAPKFRETTLGRVEVRQTFKLPKMGMVAGSYVVDGVVQRGAQVRLLRDNKIIFEGKMASLRRFKDDVKEVQAGYECGIGIEGYGDIKSGDVIEVFKVEQVPV